MCSHLIMHLGDSNKILKSAQLLRANLIDDHGQSFGFGEVERYL